MHRAEKMGGRSVFHDSRVARLDPNNHMQRREVSAVEWCDYETCCRNIRPYNTAKLKMLKDIHPVVHKYLQRRNPDTRIQVEYLMICRRHSFAYGEWIRAQCDLHDKDYARQLLSEMTIKEREKIATLTFSELWMDLWQNDYSVPDKHYHRAETKFQALCQSDMAQSLQKTMPKSVWTCPEWGFPKGKPNMLDTGEYEDGQTCAQREMAEETGIHSRYAYQIMGKKSGFYEDPHRDVRIDETFTGTDGRRYRHVYYIAEYAPPPPRPLAVTRPRPLAAVTDDTPPHNPLDRTPAQTSAPTATTAAVTEGACA